MKFYMSRKPALALQSFIFLRLSSVFLSKANFLNKLARRKLECGVELYYIELARIRQGRRILWSRPFFLFRIQIVAPGQSEL
ncbi:hypothetical protein DMN77_16370 [Paenibacillus sp. 79R4]|nr:hypothetical protein [Paenibacillus sp. 79R4]